MKRRYRVAIAVVLAAITYVAKARPAGDTAEIRQE